MESSLTESVQQLVRPGKCIDLYYPDPETAGKQCFRTSQNTRYVQNFTNLGGGSNTFTIPPNNGIQDCIITLGLPAGMSQYMGLPRGWGYALIKQISFRYGGSSQYFMSGQQVLQSVLSQASNGASRDALLSLGGNALVTANGTDPAQYAYCWLPLPHCVPTALGKLPPLPSDLLTQQIQIVVELYPVSQIISLGTSFSGTVPASLSIGQFQVQQVILENQGDALARRVDMTSHALSYPVNFRQQEVTVGLGSVTPSAGATQTVTLTGFRSGEVREIHCWLTSSGDTTGTPGTVAGSTAYIANPFAWYALENVSMTYAGEVYARGDYNSTQLWNLVNGKIPSSVNDVGLSGTTTPVISSTPRGDNWSVLPFGQSYESITAHSMYVAGKPITNGIVNLSFTVPVGATAGTFTLHVSYIYNACLTFSQGTVDYVF
jgi:hypothetical protein